MIIKIEDWNRLSGFPPFFVGILYSRNYIRPANETELYLVPAFLSLLASG